MRPPRAGMVCSMRLPPAANIAPTRLPCRVSRRARVVTKSISIARFWLSARAKVHRRAEVEQKPGGDLAIFDVLADIGRIHARRDVPVDVANIIFRLVFAQIGKIHPVAVEQAAVVALQQAIQPADDLPVEALQDAFRRCRGSLACSCKGTTGIGMRSRIFFNRSSPVTLSESASYDSTSRCRITSSAMSSTSCGRA